jgi:uncharacterized SAM-binding protein YcdF (DUF218 family)
VKHPRLVALAVLAVLAPPAASFLRVREGMARYGGPELPEAPTPLPTLVLGMGGPSLLDRADRAIELWRAGLVRTFYVSGGQGADEDESEAATLARALRQAGVPEERIEEEATSTSTWENLRNVRALMLAARADDGAERVPAASPLQVLIVTHAYHAQRTLEMATALGFEARVVGTEGTRLDRRAYRIAREVAAYLLWRARRSLASDEPES